MDDIQNNSRYKNGLHVLRIGLAIVFLWFGFSQLFDSLQWVNIVPDWAVNLFHIPPAMIVLANGILEVVLGGLLAMKLWVRPIAIILAAHLAIIALGFGLSATGLRDFGLVISTIALFMMYTRD